MNSVNWSAHCRSTMLIMNNELTQWLSESVSIRFQLWIIMSMIIIVNELNDYYLLISFIIVNRLLVAGYNPSNHRLLAIITYY